MRLRRRRKVKFCPSGFRRDALAAHARRDWPCVLESPAMDVSSWVVAVSTVVQAVFSGLLWRLQNTLRKEEEQTFVAVALEHNPTTKVATIRFENASRSGVLVRHLHVVANSKGRNAESRLDYRMTVPQFGAKEKEITYEILNVAKSVEPSHPAWKTPERLTMSVDLTPHYTAIQHRRFRGQQVTYKVEFAAGAIQSVLFEKEE